ncbi:hypothetical protein B5D77_11735 [Microcystis sp. MC19]|uniref:hypothetical protein n=1 Tax=Microcystis sp. MC19 TaxID=1967666 RepID=UPI000D12DECB|nr:hypothetical protein [Microcystis sp. MC19]AVQ71883.1 hypothetical protein B5D77_11735 [Microcystis sp. MC19]
MNIIDALNLKNPQDYPSREAYQQDVVKAVQVLMRWEHLTYAMSINTYSSQKLENLQLDHKEK